MKLRFGKFKKNFGKWNLIVCFLVLELWFVGFNLFADVDLIDLGDVPAKSAVVVELNTGRVLFGKNENKKVAMASTTKIMTALLTLQQKDLASYFEVDSDAVHIEGTSMGLLPGDKVSLRALAVGMLLPSGNDAAEAAAIRISGSRQNFLRLMNKTADSFGCTNTHFATTSGLDDKEHYSTARDMAKIARQALLNKDFAEICRQKYQTVEYGNPPYKRTLKNHNKLLQSYPYCIGIKTGFTDDAGRCLVSAAEKDGVNLIVVTLNSENICESHINIYEKAFEKLCNYAPEVSLPVNTIRVVGSQVLSVPIEKKADAQISIVKGEENKLTHKIKLKKFLLAPISKDSVVGEVDYYLNNVKVAVEPITTTIDAMPEERTGFWDRLTGIIKK